MDINLVDVLILPRTFQPWPCFKIAKDPKRKCRIGVSSRLIPGFIFYVHQHIEAETKCTLQTTLILQTHFLESKCLFCLSKFHWNSLPGIPLTIFHLWFRLWFVWRRSGDKPLSESMMALFTDVYTHNSASMIKEKIVNYIEGKRIWEVFLPCVYNDRAQAVNLNLGKQ